MNTTVTTIAEKMGLIKIYLSCGCGMTVALRVKPGEVVCITCPNPKCGETLTAVAPMRGG